MRNLVVLESLAFECTTEEGIPIKRLKHDIFSIFDGGGEVEVGSMGDVIVPKRELELVESLRGGNIYATVEDKELHYNGR